MSLLVFDRHAKQYRVVIPSTKKLPPNPHIGGSNALARALAAPSETASSIDSESPPEPRIDKTFRQRLLACDQLSFFTGSAAADLQAAHIINAIRHNPARKKGVEDLLTQQRLHPFTSPAFVLDYTPNLILLEANLHIQWNLYGTFCFVPSETDINAMHNALRSCNQRWEELVQLPIQQLRPLDVSQAPFANPHWEIIILHPSGLLPNNQPLAIAEQRFLSPNPQSQFTWKMWVASGDHLCSLNPPHEHLAPFMFDTKRDQYGIPNLSSLAMVINAHSKLERFMRDHRGLASPRVERFTQLISDLIEEMFFVPTGYPTVAASSHAATLQLSPSPRPLLEAGDLDIQDPSTTMEEEDDPYPTTEDGRHGSVDIPETPDTDGLTDSEFRLLEKKAHDPHLDSKQRSDAAMLMIFGTHRYKDPSYSAENGLV